jgi:hypothetical protein
MKIQSFLFFFLLFFNGYHSFAQEYSQQRLLIEAMARKQGLIDERRAVLFNLHQEIFQIFNTIIDQGNLTDVHLEAWESYKTKMSKYASQDLSNSNFYYSVLNWAYEYKAYFSRCLK